MGIEKAKLVGGTGKLTKYNGVGAKNIIYVDVYALINTKFDM